MRDTGSRHCVGRRKSPLRGTQEVVIASDAGDNYYLTTTSYAEEGFGLGVGLRSQAAESHHQCQGFYTRLLQCRVLYIGRPQCRLLHFSPAVSSCHQCQVFYTRRLQYQVL